MTNPVAMLQTLRELIAHGTSLYALSPKTTERTVAVLEGLAWHTSTGPRANAVTNELRLRVLAAVQADRLKDLTARDVDALIDYTKKLRIG